MKSIQCALLFPSISYLTRSLPFCSGHNFSTREKKSALVCYTTCLDRVLVFGVSLHSPHSSNTSRRVALNLHVIYQNVLSYLNRLHTTRPQIFINRIIRLLYVIYIYIDAFQECKFTLTLRCDGNMTIQLIFYLYLQIPAFSRILTSMINRHSAHHHRDTLL